MWRLRGALFGDDPKFGDSCLHGLPPLVFHLLSAFREYTLERTAEIAVDIMSVCTELFHQRAISRHTERHPRLHETNK